MTSKRAERGRRPVTPRIAACLAFVFFALLLAWPTLTGRTTSVVPSFQTATYPWGAEPRGLAYTWPQSDQAEITYPWSALAQDTWRAGELPLWDPLSFGGGTPWATDGVSATLYPVRAVLNATLPLWLSHDLFVGLHLLGAGLGAYWLARRWGASRGGALVGGVGWMTNAYVLSWSQLEMVTPFFAYLALSMAACDRAVRAPSRSSVFTAAAVFGLAMVCGNVAYAVVIATATGFYLLSLVTARAVRRRALRPVARDIAISAGIMGGGLSLASFSLIPTLVTLSSVSRQPFSFDTLTASLMVPWREYARVSHPPDSPPLALDMVLQLYVTPVLLALALLGVVTARGTAGWAGRLMLAAPVLVVSAVPAAWLAYHLLPGFDAIQPYARILPIAMLALSLLASLGLDRLLFFTRPWLPITGSRVLVATAVAGVLIPSLIIGRSQNPPALPVDDYPEFPTTAALEVITGKDAASGWPARVLPMVPTLDTEPVTTGSLALIGGTALVDGIDTWGGYASAVPRRTSQLLRLVAGEPDGEVLDTTNAPELTHPVFTTDLLDWQLACRAGTDVVYLPPMRPETAELWGSLRPGRSTTELYSGPDGRVLSLPPGCASGPYLASRSTSASSDADAVAQMRTQGARVLDRPLSPPDRTVVVSPSMRDRSDPAAEGTVVSATRDGSDLNLKVEPTGSMWLVLPVAYDAGWTAEVDGEVRATHRVDFNRVGILVDSQESNVHLFFRPSLFRESSTLSIVALTVFVVALVRRRRRPAAVGDPVPDGEDR